MPPYPHRGPALSWADGAAPGLPRWLARRRGGHCKEDTPLTLASWLPAALLAFVAAALVLPNENAYALVFYVAVLPCLAARLFTLWRARAVQAASLPSGLSATDRRYAPTPAVADLVPHVGRAAWLAAALILWSALTLVWGIDDGHRSARFALGAACTAAFLAAMLLCLDAPAIRVRLGTVLVALGAANAVWSIAVNLITHPIYPRLHGWGATSHPILGAAVIAVAGLTALARGLAPSASRPARAFNLAAFLAITVFILLTESRGPLLASGTAALFLCAVSVWRVRAFISIAALAAVWFSLPQAARQHSETVLIQRGSSHRFEIWQNTVALIRERPLFGHGLAANLHLDVGDHITFPHDLYLSLLFYSGVVGFLLFAALAALLSWRLLRTWRSAEFAWLAALWLNCLLAGLTDLGQITKGPGPIWFIVWLPLGLLLTMPVDARRHAHAGQHDAP